MTDLGTLGLSSYPRAINARGDIAGVSVLTTFELHAAVWQTGELTDLGAPPNAWSEAFAINNRDQVVGYYGAIAFLWQRGVMTDLGTLGGSYAYATAINDGGQIVGNSETADRGIHAFVWRNGVMTDLGTLGGNSSVPQARLQSINERGQVVGGSETELGETHAFVWTNGVMTDLDSLGGSEAIAINGAGDVIGNSGGHAVLWTANG